MFYRPRVQAQTTFPQYNQPQAAQGYQNPMATQQHWNSVTQGPKQDNGVNPIGALNAGKTIGDFYNKLAGGAGAGSAFSGAEAASGAANTADFLYGSGAGANLLAGGSGLSSSAAAMPTSFGVSSAFPAGAMAGEAATGANLLAGGSSAALPSTLSIQGAMAGGSGAGAAEAGAATAGAAIAPWLLPAGIGLFGLGKAFKWF